MPKPLGAGMLKRTSILYIQSVKAKKHRMKLTVVIQHSWPVGLVSLPFGAICCFLLCFFTDTFSRRACRSWVQDSLGGLELGGMDKRRVEGIG